MTVRMNKETKKDVVVKLLIRQQGATVEQMRKATGWQPHSIRAALTGLRKKGHDITRSANAKGVAVYKIIRATA